MSSNVFYAGTVESCPSSPLFLPAKPENKSVRRTRRHHKESGNRSTDSEDPAVAGVKDSSKPKRRKGQSNQKEDKGKMAAMKRAEEGQEDFKGSEVSQRTMVETVEGEGQASYTRQDQMHQKTSTKVKTPQKDHQDFKSPVKNPSEYCFILFTSSAGSFIPEREDNDYTEHSGIVFPHFEVEIQMTSSPSLCGSFHLYSL